jgi:hypothetical protein
MVFDLSHFPARNGSSQIVHPVDWFCSSYLFANKIIQPNVGKQEVVARRDTPQQIGLDFFR